jgi:hypothetical protein
MPLWTIRQYSTKYALPPSIRNLLDRDYARVPWPDDETRLLAQRWCDEHIGRKHWYYLHNCFWFTAEKYAADFRERWIEDVSDLQEP